MLIIANSVGMDNEKAQSVPNEIKILPVGVVNSEKGNFIVDKEAYEAMKAEMQRRGVDIVVDYEHQTLKDCQAPAGGWVKELIYTPDAIIAKVEWTSRAKEYLENKEYKYISPVVLTRKKDRKAIVLHSLALTNTPAINGMFAIVNSVKTDSEEDDGGIKSMDMLKIKELLGLPAKATDEEVMATLIERLSIVEKQAHKLEVDNALDNALRSGKIMSCQLNDMRTFAEFDIEKFKAFINKAPQVVPMGKINFPDTPKRASGDAKDICKALGLSIGDYEKYNSIEF